MRGWVTPIRSRKKKENRIDKLGGGRLVAEGQAGRRGAGWSPRGRLVAEGQAKRIRKAGLKPAFLFLSLSRGLPYSSLPSSPATGAESHASCNSSGVGKADR